MSKRILALLLCGIMLVSCLVSCSDGDKSKKEEDSGAYITMYLSDDIFDFDPANAYYNTDTLNVVSLMYDTLFTLNDNGKVEKSLVDDYTIKEDDELQEYTMELRLKETYWSNGDRISAEDVVYAWKRLLNANNNFTAASLLYDIKNARSVKEGDSSIDDIGIEAVELSVVKVTFEGRIDYDQFLLNLTSVATAPLLENYVTKNDDWAKKPSSMVTSGPFKLGKAIYQENGSAPMQTDDWALDERKNLRTDAPTKYPAKELAYFYLERNMYYFRNRERDSITASVTPYRILVDCTKTDEEILNEFKNGHIFYIGSIPLSLRGDEYVKQHAKVTDALSTFVCYLNENAFVDDGSNVGAQLFANKSVRHALSLAINREEIANAVVYAKAATGLVCPGVFNEGKVSKKDFRTIGGALIENTSGNIESAKQILSDAGIKAKNYAFSIKVAGEDDVNVAIVEQIASAWKELGFKVTVEKVYPIENNDILKELVNIDREHAVPTDICDDLFVEDIRRGTFEVIAFDYNAFSVDAASMLSNWAYAFAGSALNATSWRLEGHLTGYQNVEYDTLMEAIYYIPYFSTLDHAPAGAYRNQLRDKKLYVESAASTVYQMQTAIDNAKVQMNAAIAAVNTDSASKDTQTLIQAITSSAGILNDSAIALTQAAKASEKNIAMLKGNTEAINAVGITMKKAADSADTSIKNMKSYSSTVQNESKKLNSSSTPKELAETQNKVLECFNAMVQLLNRTIESISKANADMNNLLGSVDQTTLYDAIAAVYAQNNITPTDDSSDWTEQKAILLHKAEEMLIGEDMALIPVLFNQNAVLIHDDLSKVTSNYYVPALFRKTKLKDYELYIPALENFPVVAWDKKIAK